MDAETREALELLEMVRNSTQRWMRGEGEDEFLAQVARIEQTLRDLSEKAAALDLAHANAEKLRLAGVDSWDALAERLERAEHLLEMEAIRASQWEEAALAAERERDEARKERSDAVTTAARAMERSSALAERVERAERERDDYRTDRDSYDELLGRKMVERDEWHNRAEAAEAEAARLRGAIRAARHELDQWVYAGQEFRRVERAEAILDAALSPPTDGEAGDG